VFTGRGASCGLVECAAARQFCARHPWSTTKQSLKAGLGRSTMKPNGSTLLDRCLWSVTCRRVAFGGRAPGRLSRMAARFPPGDVSARRRSNPDSDGNRLIEKGGDVTFVRNVVGCAVRGVDVIAGVQI
jgi:hypothetical protein